MVEKYQIRKGSVQETLLIPLQGRKMAMDMYPDLFHDRECQELFDRIAYDFHPQGNFMGKIGALMGATRQYDMAAACREYLKQHPNACVVNIGCGLDTTFRQVDNGTAKGIHIDFPDVIEAREALLPKREREVNLASDVMDFSWFDQVPYRKEDGIVFFASGVFYYFKRDDVRRLLSAMAQHFEGGRIIFDATNATGLKSMAKTWLDTAGMKEIGVYFSVEDEREIAGWSGRFARVTQRGYMTGYRPLSRRYGWLTNCIFQFLDKTKRCQIIEITFC